jgi:hypothetical protein
MIPTLGNISLTDEMMDDERMDETMEESGLV